MYDTICALATSLGGAISIIRVSGEQAITVVNEIFKGKNLKNAINRHIYYGHIIDENEIIDEVLVSVFKAPKTYTKEDVVEINCHGGIASTKKILELLLTKNIRLAEKGEFTKRAFLNGRIDLCEAEAVNNLIQSKTDIERKLAICKASGRVSKKINTVRNLIVELMANIEVNIDYPEYEDALVITKENLLPKLYIIKQEIEKLLEESNIGKIIESGIKVAIIGRPNTGKSSILNTLLKENKAIVTDIAGTTRDIVEGTIELNGIELKFIDTAGIRKTLDVVEKMGVEKSLNLIEEADLIIHVLNNNEVLNETDNYIMDKVKDKKHITFINKSDLPNNLKLNSDEIVYGNTVENNGLENLKSKIIQMFMLGNIETQSLDIVSSAREISLVKEALKSINDAIENNKKDIPVDMIAIDIKLAWEALGKITGSSYQDELIDTLFSKFCLGK